MIQEVQVTLTLEVDVKQYKSNINNFIMELIRTHTLSSSVYNRIIFHYKLPFDIKEEKEIYNLE